MDDIVTLFKALADERRLRIAGLLSQKALSVEEIAAAVDLAPATVSHHLGYLRRAGLVDSVRQQYYTVYTLTPEPLLDAMRSLAERPAPPDLEDDLDKYDRKILKENMVDGRFVRIPAQRKKRDVLLRFLLKLFEPERRYPEKEVNLIILEYHDDFATFRRELVDGGYMAREAGIYWRIDKDGAPDETKIIHGPR
ncbi:MAG TPA: metalloregulator ArsR/SmtB family transcription factor [Armatimonadota bacterium]|jgi:biotin operon repressor